MFIGSAMGKYSATFPVLRPVHNQLNAGKESKQKTRCHSLFYSLDITPTPLSLPSPKYYLRSGVSAIRYVSFCALICQVVIDFSSRFFPQTSNEILNYLSLLHVLQAFLYTRDATGLDLDRVWLDLPRGKHLAQHIGVPLSI